MDKYLTKEDILAKAKETEGKTFGEIDLFNRIENKNNKGNFGHIIEESLYGYDINNRAEADFIEAGVELKVTPYVKNKNGTYSAKERLVLNIIDYNSEYKYEFETSSFWSKNKSLILFFYLFDLDLPREEYIIKQTLLYEYPEEDLEIIMNDWQKIVGMIKAGKAHEISESDTLYLGACTKGTDKFSLRTQPFSNEHAKQRAFSLKQSYMTYLLREYVLGKSKNEKIIKDVNELKVSNFEDIIYNKLKPYFGKSQNQLIAMFNINTNAKNINEIILSRMLNIHGKISETEEFKKANIVPKTIRVNKNNTITESMSFPTFKYTEIIGEEWETSQLREMFETTKFMFTIFKYKEDDNLYFDSIKFWRIPNNDLDVCVKNVWEKTVNVIKSGNIVKKIKLNGVKLNNFPNKSDNRVSHVRPHAKNGEDQYPLPVEDNLTTARSFVKSCFWLNNDYILEQISNKSLEVCYGEYKEGKLFNNKI